MSTLSSAADRWRRILFEQRRSGLSVAEFCRRSGVAASSFFYWRRRLAAGRRARRGVRTFVELALPTAAGARVPAGGIETGVPRIELRLPGRRRIVVRAGFDRRTLLDLLSVLEAGVEDAARSRATSRATTEAGA